MIQMQDVTVFDMPIEVQAQEQRIAELDRNYNLSPSNSAYTYKYEKKKQVSESFAGWCVMFLIYCYRTCG